MPKNTMKLCMIIMSTVCAFAIAPTTGCAAVSNALPHVVAAVTDGIQVLDAIEHFTRTYFASKPDAAYEARVAKVIARTRSALNAALRTSEGAQKLDQQKIDAAFSDFKIAYQELLALVGPLGVTPASGGAFSASEDGAKLAVPEPVALTLRVR